MKKFLVAFLMIASCAGLMAQTAPQAVKASDATVVAQDAASADATKSCAPDCAKASCCSATRTGAATSTATTTTAANTVSTEAAPKSCCAAKGKGEQAGANGSCQSVSMGMSAKKPE